MKSLAAFFAMILCVSVQAFAESNPLEGELFPPDFLFAQREALGLSDTQMQDLQAIVQDVQPRFEALKGQLEERVKTLQEALHQPKPDMAMTETKLRSMLTQENEMKVLQIGLMLSLRNKLTPEQVAKARELRPKFAGTASNPADGLRERLQGKFEQLRTLIEARAAGGVPPEDIVTKARDIQQLVQSGKPLEAERALDALLASLNAAKGKP
jgi:hypothetical protein